MFLIYKRIFVYKKNMNRRIKISIIIIIIFGVFVVWLQRRKSNSVATSTVAVGAGASGGCGAVAPPVPPKPTETPVTGRWVRVQRYQSIPNGENYVHIAQIIAYDENGNRIPVGAGSVVSDYSTNTVGRAEALWDNNRDTIVHTNNAPNAYCEIDLGQNHRISCVDVWNRRDCCGGRIVGTKLVVVDASGRTVASYPFATDKPEYRLRVFLESPGIREL